MKIRRRTFVLALASAVALSLSLPALAGPTLQSKYRKLVGEEGNCVFSGAQLPFDKEDTYTDLRTAWTGPESPREARCWFPDTVEAMTKRGVIGNTLTVDNEYLVYVLLQGRERGAAINAFKKNVWQKLTPDIRAWQTQRMILDPTDKRCFIKGFGSAGSSDAGCVDWDKMGRRMAKDGGVALPYTYDVCLTFQYNYADRREDVYDPNTGAMVPTPVLETHAFSSGCFEYTVK